MHAGIHENTYQLLCLMENESTFKQVRTIPNGSAACRVPLHTTLRTSLHNLKLAGCAGPLRTNRAHNPRAQPYCVLDDLKHLYETRNRNSGTFTGTLKTDRQRDGESGKHPKV